MGFDGGPSMLAKFITILLAFGLNCLWKELKTKYLLLIVVLRSLRLEQFHKQFRKFVFQFPTIGLISKCRVTHINAPLKE